MAVARHLTCTLQHIKRNAETEGQGTLEVSVAKQKLRVVRDGAQEGARLLATSANSLGLLLVRRLAIRRAHRRVPSHVVAGSSSVLVSVVSVHCIRPGYLRRITVSGWVSGRAADAEQRITLPHAEGSSHLLLGAPGSPR